jgi:hypothetical protein
MCRQRHRQKFVFGGSSSVRLELKGDHAEEPQAENAELLGKLPSPFRGNQLINLETNAVRRPYVEHP